MHPTAENIRAIVELERQATAAKSRAQRFSDVITRAVGSLRFVGGHLIGLAGWTGWNVFAPPALRFDAYPFGLLTFIVSLEGVLIATFVLIAQNRMSAQSDRRDHLNLQVNLLAEQEMTLVLRLLRRIAERLDVKPKNEEEERAARLTEETDVFELMRSLQRALPDESEPTSR